MKIAKTKELRRLSAMVGISAEALGETIRDGVHFDAIEGDWLGVDLGTMIASIWSECKIKELYSLCCPTLPSDKGLALFKALKVVGYYHGIWGEPYTAGKRVIMDGVFGCEECGSLMEQEEIGVREVCSGSDVCPPYYEPSQLRLYCPLCGWSDIVNV